MDNDFKKLFMCELGDIFSAEKQIVQSLPKMVAAAESPDLKEGIQTHWEESQAQVERLEKIFSLMGSTPPSDSCPAMEGLIKECDEVVQKFPMSLVRDAAIIAKLQRIEHYEIAVYGTLRTFAKQLELKSEIYDLLEDSLDEEGSADHLLTKLAEGGWFTSGINKKASKE